MKIFAFILILFWIIVIVNPDIIAYLIWGLVIFIWINILFFSLFVKKERKETFVKFWDYKIFR